MFRDREAFHTGINNYVPAMAYASELVHGQPTAFSLGTPVVADIDGIATAIDADATVGTIELYSYTADSPFGRNLSVNANADPGAGSILEVHGFDYLGQPMLERFAPASGGVVAITGKKAFYRVTHTKIAGAAANATTLDLGWGSLLGLPYKGMVDWAKEDGVPIAALTGITLAAPVLTDPATATTGDPRGTYLGALTLNGVKEVIVGLQGDNWVNSSGNGGLHGIRHYYA